MPEMWSKDWILQYDKAPAHKALSVKQFLAQKSITEVEHPPNPLIWLQETSGKVKVKSSLCSFLTEHHAMKAYWGSGDISTHFFNHALDGGER
jgi:hypothetical protein